MHIIHIIIIRVGKERHRDIMTLIIVVEEISKSARKHETRPERHGPTDPTTIRLLKQRGRRQKTQMV